MRNQIETANRLKLRAETINSTNSDDWQAVRQRLLNDEIDLLLISPERLANDDFVANNDFVVKGLNACVSGKRQDHHGSACRDHAPPCHATRE